MPNSLVYLSIINFINNLYANSLIALLNARESFTLTDIQDSDSNSQSSGNNVALPTDHQHSGKRPDGT
ncbi:hypothetical protein OF83DRAFT_1179427 [Amylostereum chailletii]|nr:hypothetical protein OF83DRAFT_1179427 [Amylostereum chailletii]